MVLFIVAYILMGLFTTGVGIGSRTDPGFLVCLVAGIVWPLVFPIWVGSSVQACLDKHLSE